MSEVGITDGLVAWYPLNGNSIDLEQHKRHATIGSGNVSYQPAFDGKIGAGFNGSSHLQVTNFYNPSHADSVFLGSSPQTTNNWSGDSTYSAWVKPGSVDSTHRFVFCDNNYNEGYISFRTSSIYCNWGSGNVLNYSIAVDPNKWYHVIMWHQRDDVNDLFRLKLYIDGVLRGNTTTSISGSGSWYGPDNRLVIGHLLNGIVSDVRIYGRCLSDEEVGILYNATKPNPTKMQMTSTGLYISGEFKEV